VHSGWGSIRVSFQLGQKGDFGFRAFKVSVTIFSAEDRATKKRSQCLELKTAAICAMVFAHSRKYFSAFGRFFSSRRRPCIPDQIRIDRAKIQLRIFNPRLEVHHFRSFTCHVCHSEPPGSSTKETFQNLPANQHRLKRSIL
jgi:hypothetical protein